MSSPEQSGMRRVIACLDVANGRVVKGTNFEDLQDAGDPVELAVRYEEEGADEIFFLDITATSDKRGTVTELARRVGDRIYIPRELIRRRPYSSEEAMKTYTSSRYPARRRVN
jgi:hypothetical protein